MLLFVFLSCQHHPITPKEAVREYKISMEGIMEDPTSDGVVNTITVDLTLKMAPHERFPDDSISYTMWVTQAQMTQNGEEISNQLVDKWVRPRAFEHGELLSVQHMDLWSQDDPIIQSFDILWFVLYPNPPNINKGESKPSLARYPLRFSELQKSRAVYNNRWELQSVSKNATLAYSGKTDIRGVWNDWKQSGKGSFHGDVLVAPQGGIPVRHSGEIRRKICYAKESQVCQDQTFRFTLDKK